MHLCCTASIVSEPLGGSPAPSALREVAALLWVAYLLVCSTLLTLFGRWAGFEMAGAMFMLGQALGHLSISPNLTRSGQWLGLSFRQGYRRRLLCMSWPALLPCSVRSPRFPWPSVSSLRSERSAGCAFGCGYLCSSNLKGLPTCVSRHDLLISACTPSARMIRGRPTPFHRFQPFRVFRSQQGVRVNRRVLSVAGPPGDWLVR
jgi:hypothetical protein